jgi:hypothetical protein
MASSVWVGLGAGRGVLLPGEGLAAAPGLQHRLKSSTVTPASANVGLLLQRVARLSLAGFRSNRPFRAEARFLCFYSETHYGRVSSCASP